QREEIDTDHYHGGMVAEASGALRPALYHCGLADAARRAGALVVEETPVDAITRGASGFMLRTSRGVVEAREVIVATNGYTGAVTPWLRRRLIPLASYIIATEPPPPETARRLIPRGRMTVDTNRALTYYRPPPDGTRALYAGRASSRRATAHAPDLYRRSVVSARRWQLLPSARLARTAARRVTVCGAHRVKRRRSSRVRRSAPPSVTRTVSLKAIPRAPVYMWKTIPGSSTH